jgi:predicted phage-related endonuclease
MDAKTYADLHRGAVGGGEIMTVAGLNKYQSPRDLYEIKIGERDPDELDNWHIDRGTFREPGNLAWASKRTGIEFLKPPEPYRRGPFIVTPDGVGKDADGNVVIAEIKSPGDWAALDWGADGSGSEGVPVKHLPQIMVEEGAAGSPYGYAFGDVGGFLRCYRIPYSAELFDELEGLALEFLDHVKRKIPPEIDGTAASKAWLERRYPESLKVDLVKVDSDEVEQSIWALKDLETEIAELKKGADLYRNTIKDALGELPGYVGDFGKIHWKKSKDSKPKPDAERILAELRTIIQVRASQVKIDDSDASHYAERLLREIDALESMHTTQRKGARPFRPYWAK